MIKKTSIYSLIQYLLIVYLILDCNTVYSAANTDFYIPEIAAIIVVVLFIVHVYMFNMDMFILQRWLVIFSLYYIIVIFYTFFSVTLDSLLTYFIRFMVLLPILSFINAQDIKRENDFLLFRKFSNIMTFLSITSLVLWIVGVQLELVESNMSIGGYWGGEIEFNGWFGLLFKQQYSDFFGIRIYRNQSIFAEGPMFSLCLVLALAYEIFLNKQKKRTSLIRFNIKLKIFNPRFFKIVIITIAIISTFTTTGMILAILIYVIKFIFFTENKSMRNQVFKIICSLIIAVAAIYIIYKLFGDKSDSNSWEVRLLDYYIGYTAWKSSPIYGTGYGDFINAAHVAGIDKQGFSNSIMAILSQGGILLFGIYVVPIIFVICNSLRNKNTGNLCFIFIFILELIFTEFTYKFLLLLILAYLYACLILNKFKQKEGV